MSPDLRALVWLVGAAVFVVGGVLISLPAALLAGGYVLMRWAR